MKASRFCDINFMLPLCLVQCLCVEYNCDIFIECVYNYLAQYKVKCVLYSLLAY